MKPIKRKECCFNCMSCFGLGSGKFKCYNESTQDYNKSMSFHVAIDHICEKYEYDGIEIETSAKLAHYMEGIKCMG